MEEVLSLIQMIFDTIAKYLSMLLGFAGEQKEKNV